MALLLAWVLLMMVEPPSASHVMGKRAGLLLQVCSQKLRLSVKQNLRHSVQSCSRGTDSFVVVHRALSSALVFRVSHAIQLPSQPALMKIQLGRRGEHYYLRRMGGSYLLEGSGRCWMSREKDLQGLCGAPAINPTIVVSSQL